jgi:hypothetical protein
MKLGDAFASVATPIARTLNFGCIDPLTQELYPDSNCEKRRQWLNDFGDAIYDELYQPKNMKGQTQ